MKLFVQLAVILAFAAPMFAQASSAVSSPAHKIAAKKKKKEKKKDTTKDEKKEGETAAPAEGGKM